MSAQATTKFTIRKNDLVQVMTGSDRGKTGKVMRVLGKSGRVVVERINMKKRHVKPSQQNPAGGMLEKELPIHYSNVLLMCPKCNKGVRHGMKIDAKAKGGAKKTRVCKKCDTALETSK
ncbi:MAG: 50S ribosomal protein L24 [Bacteriovoracia bacterium]